MKRYILLLLLFTSCKKFLDIQQSTTTVNPTTIRDFQEMLNNDSLSTINYTLLDLMSDDAALTTYEYGLGDSYQRRTYLWASTIWNLADEDVMYSSSYTRILQMNIILNRISAAPQDSVNTVENRSIVISQALINRAYYYLQLVNAYGPAYNEGTAATDLGVPLVLVPDEYALSGRATVKEVYDRVIADLQQAVNNTYLSAKGADIIHPGKAAGYALLARAFLYKGDYAAAGRYADSTLALANDVYDQYTNAYNPGTLFLMTVNPEVLLGRISLDRAFYAVFNGSVNVSQALLDSMGSTWSDARYFNKFSSKSYKLNTGTTGLFAFDCSVGVPEVLLIKAESLARNGDVTNAAAILTRIRTKRRSPYATADPTYTADNILDKVLGERRRELNFKGGLRLFDMKRLKQNTVYRINGTDTVGTLPPGSNRYLMPFSNSVIASNPNIVQNPR